MNIQKITQSKLSNIKLESLAFGETFSDHMLVCYYKDGKWGTPSVEPYGPISVFPSLKAIHYGQSIFEGMKAFKDQDKNVFLYRPEMNFKRMNDSAKRMAMPEVPAEVFLDGLKALVDLDSAWIPETPGASLYLRPFMFASESAIRAASSSEYIFMIICSPVNTYYDQPLKVKIADKFSRSASGGVGSAKVAGNYAASFLPTIEVSKEGFDQIIWTDSSTHTFLEEAGTMNVFARIGDTLFTPCLSDRILHGITRDSVIQIAKSKSIEVIEQDITVETIVNAHKDGSLKEVFGCGTAVVVSQFSSIGYKDQLLTLPVLQAEESYAVQIKKWLQDIQYNRAEDPFGWRVAVK
ncbi:MAG: branched chain amino acid aminotransferase [Flavobacteriaceae bacterium]|nr:MAG: branched chain amino acid aminotransferase [Flavobacteriaceae bacterium]